MVKKLMTLRDGDNVNLDKYGKVSYRNRFRVIPGIPGIKKLRKDIKSLKPLRMDY